MMNQQQEFFQNVMSEAGMQTPAQAKKAAAANAAAWKTQQKAAAKKASPTAYDWRQGKTQLNDGSWKDADGNLYTSAGVMYYQAKAPTNPKETFWPWVIIAAAGLALYLGRRK